MLKINWFNFYPVGQGLFYAGILERGSYSFVYDCGTETSGVNISNYIEHLAYYLPHRKLDFLVLSHFHKDHISGVNELLRVFDVKKIIIPYICDDFSIRFAVLAAIMSFSMQSEEILTIIERLIRSESGFEWQINDNNCCHHEIILPYWRFDFITKPISDAQYTGIKTRYSNLLNKTGCNDILELIRKGHIDELKKEYESVFKKGNKLNETSVIMLHQPINHNPFDYVVRSIPNLQICPYGLKYKSPSSLLTGDAMIEYDISLRIKSLINTDIGIIQVPHHGSYENWRTLKAFINLGNSIYIIPHGTHNRYKHPSKRTLIDLKGYEHYSVTEFCGYPYWIYVLDDTEYIE